MSLGALRNALGHATFGRHRYHGTWRTPRSRQRGALYTERTRAVQKEALLRLESWPGLSLLAGDIVAEGAVTMAEQSA